MILPSAAPLFFPSFGLPYVNPSDGKVKQRLSGFPSSDYMLQLENQLKGTDNVILFVEFMCRGHHAIHMQCKPCILTGLDKFAINVQLRK